jgi:hypothetical protein
MMSAKLSIDGSVCLLLSILSLFCRFPMDHTGSGTLADVGVRRGSHTSTVGVRSGCAQNCALVAGKSRFRMLADVPRLLDQTSDIP